MSEENVKDENLEEIENQEFEESFDDSEEIIEENLKEETDENDLLKESFARLQADFVNYKRRTEQEKSDYLDLGVSKVIIDILPIVDNFERALEVKEDSKFYEGVEMIYTQIKGLLDKNGVEEIESLNEKFDSNIHHAVFVEEVDGLDSDIVTEVLQKGYRLGEKVLRPAMVKVSQ